MFLFSSFFQLSILKTLPLLKLVIKKYGFGFPNDVVSHGL